MAAASVLEEPSAELCAAVPVMYLREEVWALLPSLHACASLEQPELWAEVALLERLLYKNKSQHAGSRHYQRLAAVRGELRRLRRLALAPALRRLVACLPAAASPQAATLPCAALGALVARRLLAGARLAAAARAPLARAASDCRSLLSASYFMPLALCGLSICARVAALLRAHLAASAAAYNSLAPLLAWLPPPCESPAAPPLPELLRCDWGSSGGGADGVVLLGQLEGHGGGAEGRATPLQGMPSAPSALVFEQRSVAAAPVAVERPRYSLAVGRGLEGASAGQGGASDALALLFGGIH